MLKKLINILFVFIILMQFIFPTMEEKVIGSNTDTEELIEIAAITNKRSMKIYIPDMGKKATAIELCFLAEGSSKEGQIVYRISNSENVVCGEGEIKVKDLYNSEEGVINFTKIYLDEDQRINGKFVIDIWGEEISQYTRVGLYGNAEDVGVQIESNIGYNEKTPLFQILGMKRSYPYMWDTLLLWGIYFTISSLWCEKEQKKGEDK